MLVGLSLFPTMPRVRAEAAAYDLRDHQHDDRAPTRSTVLVETSRSAVIYCDAFATACRPRSDGICHTVIAIMRPMIRPASAASQAARCSTPSVISTAMIGRVATVKDSARLSPTGVNRC